MLALVVDGGEVFGIVIGPVVGAWRSKKIELALCVMALQPMKLNIYELKPFGHDGVVDNAICCRVVSLDG